MLLIFVFLPGSANFLDQVDLGDGDVRGGERGHRRPLRPPPLPLGARAGRRPEVHVVTA